MTEDHRPKTATRMLMCQLTDPQWKMKAEQLASLDTQIIDKEDEKKEETKRMADELKLMRTQQKKLAEQVDTRTERREVTCTWTDDFNRNVRVLRRDDTGDVVDEVALSFEDRQTDLLTN